MSCRCPDCAAAMGMFSAKDLVDVASSKVSWEEGQQVEGNNATDDKKTQVATSPAPTKKEEKPAPKVESPAAAPTATSEPTAPAAPQATPPTGNDGEPATFEGKLASANWKFRKVAYEELLEALRNKKASSAFNFDWGASNSRGGTIKKILSEKSPAGLDSALQALEGVAMNLSLGSEENEILFGKNLLTMAKKAFGGRPKTQKIAEALLLSFVEIGKADSVVDLLKKLAKERSPKIKTAAVSALKAACAAFGASLFDLGACSEIIVEALSHKVAGVRSSGNGLMVEMSRWGLGDALKVLVFAKLESDTLKADIEKAVAECGDAAPEATRHVRGTEPASSGSAKPSVASSAKAAKVDASELLYQHAQESSILDKLDKMKFEKRIKAPKWMERRSAIQDVAKACGSKLASGDYHSLTSTLKSVIANDSNQSVRVAAVQLFGTLASCLREHFKEYARSLLKCVLSRYKEKAMAVVKSANATLTAFFKYSLRVLDASITDILVALLKSSKATPLEISGMLSWLSEFAEGNKENFLASTSGAKALTECAVGLLEGANAGMRSASAKLLFCIREYCSADKSISAVFEDLERTKPKQFKKIESAGGASSEKKTRSAVGRKPRKAAPAKKAGSQKRPSPGSKMPAAEIKTTQAKKAQAQAAPNFAEVALPSIEEATAALVEAGMASLAADIKAHDEAVKWQDKAAFFELLVSFVDEHDAETVSRVASSLVAVLKSKTRDFKTANFNIMNVVWKCVMRTAQKADGPPFPRHLSALVVNASAEKLSDRKLGSAISSLFLALCETSSPRFVSHLVMNRVQKARSPKVWESAWKWLLSCAKDFGFKIMGGATVVEFAKTSYGLAATQPYVKTAASVFLVEAYRQEGPSVKRSLGDACSPALDSQFEAVGHVTDIVFARKVKESAQGDEEPESSGSSSHDLSASLDAKLLAKLCKDDDKKSWKVRMDAAAAIAKIVQSAGSPLEINSALLNTLSGLGKRMTDKQRNVAMKSAVAIGVIGERIQSGKVGTVARACIKNLVATFSDNKKAVASAAIRAMDLFTTHGEPGAEVNADDFCSLINFFPRALSSPKQNHAALLTWIIKHGKSVKSPALPRDPKALASGLVSCLSSKSAEVRKLSLEAIEFSVKRMGIEESTFLAAVSGLKPAVKRTVTPLLRGAFSSSTAASSAAPQPAEKSKAAQVSQTNSKSAGGSWLPKRGAVASRQKAAAPSNAAEEGDTVPQPAHPFTSRKSKPMTGHWPSTFDSARDLEACCSRLAAYVRANLGEKCGDALFGPPGRRKLRTVDDTVKSCEYLEDLVTKGCTASDVVYHIRVILRWIATSMQSSHSVVITRVMNLIHSTFSIVKETSFTISGSLASEFLPHLIRKLGEKQERFRVKAADTLKDVTKLCKPDIYASFLSLGLGEVKNFHMRTECMRLFAELIRDNGTSMLKVKSVSGVSSTSCIVRAAGESVKDVRFAALGCIVEIWKKQGCSTPTLIAYLKKHCSASSADKIMTIVTNYLDQYAKSHPDAIAQSEQAKSEEPQRRRAGARSRSPAARPRTKRAVPQRIAQIATPKPIDARMSISSDIAPLALPSTPPTPSGIFSPTGSAPWSGDFEDKENIVLTGSSPSSQTNSKLDALLKELRDYVALHSSGTDLSSEKPHQKVLDSLRSVIKTGVSSLDRDAAYESLLSSPGAHRVLLEDIVSILEVLKTHCAENSHSVGIASLSIALLGYIVDSAPWELGIPGTLQKRCVRITLQMCIELEKIVEKSSLSARVCLLKGLQTLVLKLSGCVPMWIYVILKEMKDSVNSLATGKCPFAQILCQVIATQQDMVLPFEHVDIQSAAMGVDALAGALATCPLGSTEAAVHAKEVLESLLEQVKSISPFVLNDSGRFAFAAPFVESSRSAQNDTDVDELTAMFSSIWQALGNGEHAKVKECIGRLAAYINEHPNVDIEPFLLKATPWFKKYLLSQLRKGSEEAPAQQPESQPEKVSENVSDIRARMVQLRENTAAADNAAAADSGDDAEAAQEDLDISNQADASAPPASAQAAPLTGLDAIRARMAQMRS